MAHLVSKAKVKAIAGLNVGEDFLNALDKAITQVVSNGAVSAKNDKRKTLKERDCAVV